VELRDPTIALGNSEYCPVTHGIVRKIEQSCSPPRKSRRTFVPPVFITLQKGRVLSETTGRALKVRPTPGKRGRNRTSLRVGERRGAVGVPWLCPPFPASCPFRSTMARPVLSPLTDPTVQISTQRVPQTLLPAQFQGWAIRGSNSGRRRRSATYFSHVSAFPRVRRLSHFRQILQTAR
jgi:hypothetical protein